MTSLVEPMPVELLERMPFPVARAAQVALGHEPRSAPQLQLWSLSAAAVQTLRLLTLPVVAQILDLALSCTWSRASLTLAPEAVLGAALRALSRPSAMAWAQLLRVLAEEITPHLVGLRPVLPLDVVVSALSGRATAAFVDPEAPTRFWPSVVWRGEPGLAAPDELLCGLHDALQREDALPDDARCVALLVHYRPVLESLLESARVLATCTLWARPGPFDEDRTLLLKLVGSTVSEGVLLGVESTGPVRDALVSDAFALETPDGVCTPLESLAFSDIGHPLHPLDAQLVELVSGLDRFTEPLRSRVVLLLRRIEGRASPDHRWRPPQDTPQREEPPAAPPPPRPLGDRRPWLTEARRENEVAEDAMMRNGVDIHLDGKIKLRADHWFGESSFITTNSLETYYGRSLSRQEVAGIGAQSSSAIPSGAPRTKLVPDEGRSLPAALQSLRLARELISHRVDPVVQEEVRMFGLRVGSNMGMISMFLGEDDDALAELSPVCDQVFELLSDGKYLAFDADFMRISREVAILLDRFGRHDEASHVRDRASRLCTTGYPLVGAHLRPDLDGQGRPLPAAPDLATYRSSDGTDAGCMLFVLALVAFLALLVVGVVWAVW